MGIERLKGSLLSEAQEDARKIISAAEAQAKTMADEEQGRRASLKKETESEITRLLEEQRNERLAWARLESKRVTTEAREDAIKNVLEGFFEALKDARKSPEYRKFIASAAASAAAELGPGSLVHVPKGDKALIGTLKGAKIVEDLEGFGGALAESADGKIRMDLTLETLFESRRDEVRKQIYDKLFGGV